MYITYFYITYYSFTIYRLASFIVNDSNCRTAIGCTFADYLCTLWPSLSLSCVVVDIIFH